MSNKRKNKLQNLLQRVYIPTVFLFLSQLKKRIVQYKFQYKTLRQTLT